MKILTLPLSAIMAISLNMASAGTQMPIISGVTSLSHHNGHDNMLLQSVKSQPSGDLCSLQLSHNFIYPEKETGTTQDVNNGFPLPQRVAPQTKERLDSIITFVNSTGEPYMATIYHYDSHNLPHLQDNCYWNPQTCCWDTVEQYGYEWNEDGYCLNQWQINYMYDNGLRYEYAYNADNLGISRTEYTYLNNEWIPSTQNLYEYDRNGFVVEEILKFYDPTSKNWINYLKHNVACDDLGRNIHWEGYVWDNDNWTPYAEQQDIVYGEDGNALLITFLKWMKGSSQWVNYYQVENCYDDGLIRSQEHKFWNRELSSWVGRDDFDTGFPCTNLKSIFEYDSKRRLVSETVYQGLTTDGYTKSVVEECVYTDTQDGGAEMQSDTYYYAEDGISRESRNRRIKHYNAADSLTYSFQTVLEGGVWINKSEEVYTYTPDNLQSSYKSYTFSNTEENKKFAGISIDYFYDDNDNLKEKFYMLGLGTSDDDWYYSTHYEYNYDLDNLQIDELCSKWNGSEFVPRNGEGMRYDYDTPVSDLILWVGSLPAYKITERRVYVNNDNEWDYYSYKHYYSVQNIETGIIDMPCGNNSLLTINSDRTLLTLNSNEDIHTTVYSANGSVVISSSERLIDLSTLPAGLYIANANGENLKFIK